MPSVEFEPTISAVKRLKTYALGRAATGTGIYIYIYIYVCVCVCVVCVFNDTLIRRSVKTFASSQIKFYTFETFKEKKTAYLPDLLRHVRISLL